MTDNNELIERLNRCADDCDVYSPDQCATLIDGIGHLAMRQLLRKAADALEAARADAAASMAAMNAALSKVIEHRNARHAAEARAERLEDALRALHLNYDAYIERLEDVLRSTLDAVRDTLQSSYNSAGQECCGRSVFECCGDPVLVWAPEDQAVMDKLAPIERLLSSALHPTAAQENDDKV